MANASAETAEDALAVDVWEDGTNGDELTADVVITDVDDTAVDIKKSPADAVAADAEAIVADDFGEMKLLIARFDVSFVEGELIELEEHLLYVLFLDAGN